MTVVLDELNARGIAAEEIPHDPAHTALGEAVRIGVPADEVAKTIVLDTKDGHALAVIPASERLDMALVHRAVGDSHAHLTSEEQLRNDYPDYELGAFPPLGSLLQAPVFIDPHVMAHESIVFAAGSATASLRARTAELFRDERITITPLIRAPVDEDKEPIDR